MHTLWVKVLKQSCSCLSIPTSALWSKAQRVSSSGCISGPVHRTMGFVLLCSAWIQLSVMFVYLEYSVMSWSSGTPIMPFVPIDCNVEVPQNGGKCTPAVTSCFINKPSTFLWSTWKGLLYTYVFVTGFGKTLRMRFFFFQKSSLMYGW